MAKNNRKERQAKLADAKRCERRRGEKKLRRVEEVRVRLGRV